MAVVEGGVDVVAFCIFHDGIAVGSGVVMLVFIAVQTDGATLPVKFKFGTDEQPVYRIFDSMADLTEFYTSAMRFIQNTLDAGWQRKDTFCLEQYQME